MGGEKDLSKILKNMQPLLNEGDYVFCTMPADNFNIPLADIICYFKEAEGATIILSKTIADGLGLRYEFVGSWITLNVHSSLEATGLTAAFSAALSKENISCNVIAAYFHDHIFVNKEDGEKALAVLNRLSK